MDYISRRPMFAVAAFTTAGALALTSSIAAPPDLHAPGIAAARISSQTVQLTDAWSDLATDTVGSVINLGGLFLGEDSTYPLPNPGFPLAPIVTQIALNQLIYLGQLFTGQGAQIPTEILTHLTNAGKTIGALAGVLPSVILNQLRTPIAAASSALETITTSGNLLTGLFEAPAVFLNIALNNQYGLIGVNGPIAIPIIVRNDLALAIDPPLPAWLAHILQPSKTPSAAALTPAAAPTVTLKVAEPSHSAASARSRSKAPSAAAYRKAIAAKAADRSSGFGHGKHN